MKHQVLVVTDRPDLPYMGVQLLLLSGTDVTMREAKLAYAWIQAADLTPYDLILIHMHRRASDNVRLCQRLRKLYPNPILVILRQPAESLLLQAFAAGADDCLVQTRNGRLLQLQVQAWLRRTKLSPGM